VIEPLSALLGFVLTLMAHASVLLALAWTLQRFGVLRQPAWAEAVWRAGLFGALVTAPLASFGPVAWRVFTPAPEATTSQAVAISERVAPHAASAAAAARPRASTIQPTAPRAPRLTSSDLAAVGSMADASTQLRLPGFAVQGLSQAWLATGMAWGLLMLWRGLGVLRLQRRARRLAPAGEAQQRQAATLAQQLALRAPSLRLDRDCDSPVVLPNATVLLPPWSHALPAHESRALLAHELAHLARRDPLWRIAMHLALVPLALHPLAWRARRELETLAERGADRLAARALGDGRALAECLARCLEHRLTSPSRSSTFALAMAERPGAVVDRVQHLLEDDPMNSDTPAPRRTRSLIGLALLACLSLPTIVVTAFADGLRHGSSVSIHRGDDGRERIDVQIKRAGYALEVEMEGKITFAADESDVIGMAGDAELEIEETRDGITRTIEFEAADRGVSRAYRLDGRAHDFDADASAWLAQVLPELFRSTGIDAEARAQRILANGGTDGLLAEIARIEGDHGRARYLGLLYGLVRLDPSQMQRALELTRAIQSDYELRQVLSRALDSQTLEPAQQGQVLALAESLDSDYERAELLIDTGARFTLDPASLALWRRALQGIDSDYEQRRVLEALLKREQNRDAAVSLAFEAAITIGSDYEKRQLLTSGMALANADTALRAQYLRAADSIGSDYERKEALLTLIRAGALDAALALGTLDAIDGIDSNYERKEALVALARELPTESAVIDRYREVASALSSYERGEAEQALDRRVVRR
jgi:beta-lactamase regulating signal transducer with metallopeptidase domain